MIPLLTREKSSDKSKPSKKYLEHYDSPKRVSSYHDIPDYEVLVPATSEPQAIVSTPGVAALGGLHSRGTFSYPRMIYARFDSFSSGIIFCSRHLLLTHSSQTSAPSPYLFADSVSLYGYDPNTKQALGLPIADAYLGAHHGQSFAFLAVADGCGWGNGPTRAAQCAVKSVYTSMMQKMVGAKTRTSRDVAHLLLTALTTANESILQSGNDASDPLSAGTTTCIAGMVLPLAKRKTDLPQFAFIGISLGDCKVYRICRRTGAVRDVIKGGPRGDNATDPGGRLGPADYHHPLVPDLRNLQLVFAFVEVGDLIVLMSDGVHDNLDPVFLGEWVRFWKSYDERSSKGKPWSNKDLENKKEVKAQALVKSLSEHSASEIGKVFMKHCHDTLQPVIEFMASTKGGGRMKQDFKQLPGKQDHATVLVYSLPSQKESSEEADAALFSLACSSPTASPLPSPRISPRGSDTFSGSASAPISSSPVLSPCLPAFGTPLAQASHSSTSVASSAQAPSGGSSPPRKGMTSPRTVSPHISPSRIKIGTSRPIDAGRKSPPSP